MQLRVLVDRPVDREEEPALLQLLEMLVKIAIAARGCRDAGFGGTVHCFGIFAASTTFFHFPVSDTSRACSASGVLPRASTPRSCRRCFPSRAATTALISRFSRSLMTFCVLHGAATPFQAETS